MKTSYNSKKKERNVLTSSLFHVFNKIRRHFQHIYRNKYCSDNYIFKFEGPFEKETRPECTFASYNDFDDIPEHVKKGICQDSNVSRLGIDKLELSEMATLWVAFSGEKVATTVFTRKGKYFRRWFVGLEPEDCVVFRLNTRLEFRGRGFASLLIRHALWEISKGDSDGLRSAYIDCRTYNKPSKRCIEKAGFTCIGIKKTITREWALYE